MIKNNSIDNEMIITTAVKKYKHAYMHMYLINFCRGVHLMCEIFVKKLYFTIKSYAIFH